MAYINKTNSLIDLHSNRLLIGHEIQMLASDWPKSVTGGLSCLDSPNSLIDVFAGQSDSNISLKTRQFISAVT